MSEWRSKHVEFYHQTKSIQSCISLVFIWSLYTKMHRPMNIKNTLVICCLCSSILNKTFVVRTLPSLPDTLLQILVWRVTAASSRNAPYFSLGGHCFDSRTAACYLLSSTSWLSLTPAGQLRCGDWNASTTSSVKFLTIQYSLIIPPFDALYSEIPTASFNET